MVVVEGSGVREEGIVTGVIGMREGEGDVVGEGKGEPVGGGLDGVEVGKDVSVVQQQGHRMVRTSNHTVVVVVVVADCEDVVVGMRRRRRRRGSEGRGSASGHVRVRGDDGHGSDGSEDFVFGGAEERVRGCGRDGSCSRGC